MVVETPRAVATRLESTSGDLCCREAQHYRECFVRGHSTSGYHREVLLRHPLSLFWANSYSLKVLDGASHVELDRLFSVHQMPGVPPKSAHVRDRTCRTIYCGPPQERL